MKNILLKFIGEDKHQNGALDDGTNQEIEFLFRTGDIGVIATHYRNVGHNEAKAELRAKVDEVVEQVVKEICQMEIDDKGWISKDELINKLKQ